MPKILSASDRVKAYLGADRLWREVRIKPFEKPRPAVFLDRDGVIIEEKCYLSDPAHVKLLPGAAELIHAARSTGMPVIEITNQAGIARGKYGWSEFAAVEARLRELLSSEDAQIDAVFACPFHPSSECGYQHDSHPWRKPNPGMLLEAQRLLNLDLPRSLLVGDKAVDVGAARAAGLSTAVQVLTGHGVEHAKASAALATASFRVLVLRSAGDVIQLLGFAD